MSEDEVRGCGKKYCWKCANQARDELGEIRTTKTEFCALDNPWWMHDKCMSKADEKAYFGEDDAKEDTKGLGYLPEDDEDAPET